MPDRKGILCAGTITLDRVRTIDRWPEQETLAHILSVEQDGGGCAHNVAVNLRCLDPAFPVAVMGMIGDDDDGDFIIETFKRHGIDYHGLHRSQYKPTSYTEVYNVQGSGRRTFFHDPGTNQALTPDHFDLANSSASVLQLGLLGLHENLDKPWKDSENGWVHLLKTARAVGMQTSIELVSIDPGRIREIATPCLPHLDYLIVNDFEIGALANIETVKDGITDKRACLEAANQAFEVGINLQCVVVHFPTAAICLRRGQATTEVSALRVPESVLAGNVGAGDAFAAGMMYGLYHQWPDARSIDLAHAAAACSLTSTTTTGGVGRVKDCLEKSLGWRNTE